MSKPRVLNLRRAEARPESEPEVYTDRMVLTLTGVNESGEITNIVHVQLAWDSLPWLMRKIWRAWWQHKMRVLGELASQERELAGSGVEKPKELGP